MGMFAAAHGWEVKKAPPTLPKICQTYPTMMKLGIVIPFLKKIQKHMNYMAHPMNSADIRIFSPEIKKFCYIKKYRYRFHLSV